MDAKDVARLAAAIATANGHSHTEEYAASVVKAWEALGESPSAPPESEEETT